MFLGRNNENYPWTILRYPHLFYCHYHQYLFLWPEEIIQLILVHVYVLTEYCNGPHRMAQDQLQLCGLPQGHQGIGLRHRVYSVDQTNMLNTIVCDNAHL